VGKEEEMKKVLIATEYPYGARYLINDLLYACNCEIRIATWGAFDIEVEWGPDVVIYVGCPPEARGDIKKIAYQGILCIDACEGRKEVVRQVEGV